MLSAMIKGFGFTRNFGSLGTGRIYWQQAPVYLKYFDTMKIGLKGKMTISIHRGIMVFIIT
jgi:hypothetical protein